MKKTNLILTGLLVLLASVTLLTGCGPEKEKGPDPTVPDNVMSDLRNHIGYKGDFFTPDDTNYFDYDYNPNAIWDEDEDDGITYAKVLNIAWEDADSDKFNSYKAKWGSKVNKSQARAANDDAPRYADVFTLKLTGGFEAEVYYFDVAQEFNDALYVPSGSIVFYIYAFK